MGFGWLAWSNPVSIWWMFLISVAAVNVLLWTMPFWLIRKRARLSASTIRIEPMMALAALYVFACAFRSVLPRADVQRICLFDTWLSSVFVGRSVATVAEICFVLQWAILLHYLSRMAKSATARNISNVIVPLILIAECYSWYAVITTNYIGNIIENSLWAVTFLLIAVALSSLLTKFTGVVRRAISAKILGIAAYASFMFIVDLPMYFERWQADVSTGREYLGFFAGLHDASSRTGRKLLDS